MRRFVFKPRWIFGHFMVVAAALTCIRLADWQLSRAHITEAMQNWGYAFQWPLFSVFFLIGWWRMLRLESIRLDELEAEEAADTEAADTEAADTEAADADVHGETPSETEAVAPAVSGPLSPEDDQLAAYNRMLARLAAQDAARDEAGRR